MRPNEERGLRPLLRVNEKVDALKDQRQQDCLCDFRNALQPGVKPGGP
jgi:hypothetical protein